MSELVEIESLHRVRPGETLVVKVSRETPPDRFDEIVEELTSRVADGVKVLVLGGDLDVGAMATADADSIAEAIRKATENPGKTFEVGQ